MKLAICDDEQVQTEYLIKLVNTWAERNSRHIMIETYDRAEAFQFAWSEDKSYDVLLLDIQMPGRNGMELAKEIRKSDHRLAIIFITGFSDYMSEGYDVEALHYLLKPIDEAKLFSVLDKAIGRTAAVRSVLLPAAGGNIRLTVDDIVYAEAFSHLIEIHTLQQIYSARLSMNELEKQVGDGFFRCHRSYLVNMKHVRRVTRTGMVLETDGEIPLSRKLYDQANQAFIRCC